MSSAPSEERPEFGKALRRLAIVGGAGVALFTGTVGVWAVATTWSGAVVSTGQFVVDGNVKKVQYPTGFPPANMHASHPSASQRACRPTSSSGPRTAPPAVRRQAAQGSDRKGVPRKVIGR